MHTYGQHWQAENVVVGTVLLDASFGAGLLSYLAVQHWQELSDG